LIPTKFKISGNSRASKASKGSNRPKLLKKETITDWYNNNEIEIMQEDGINAFVYKYSDQYESVPCVIKLSKDQKKIRWYLDKTGVKQTEINHFGIFDIHGILYGPQTGTFMSQRNNSYFQIQQKGRAAFYGWHCVSIKL
jgi:hypothetical protein